MADRDEAACSAGDIYVDLPEGTMVEESEGALYAMSVRCPACGKLFAATPLDPQDRTRAYIFVHRPA